MKYLRLLPLLLLAGCDIPTVSQDSKPSIAEIYDVHNVGNNVVGLLKNGSEYAGYFRVEFAAYRSDGTKLRVAADRIASLRAGEQWEFNVRFLEPFDTYGFERVMTDEGEASVAVAFRK